MMSSSPNNNILKRLYHYVKNPKGSIKNMSQPISTDPDKEAYIKSKDLDKQDQDTNTTVPPPQQQQTENVIPTTAEVQTQQQETHSSINPNAQDNGQPVYTSENPLMQPPPNQQQNQQLSQPTTEDQQNNQQRSNTETEPPIIAATTSAGITAAKPKPDTSNLDSSIISTLIQLTVLYHNKIALLSGDNQQQP